MVNFYKTPTQHDSIPERFTPDELRKIGLNQTINIEESELIVSALIEELIPIINIYGNKKRYLLWCDEPLWSNFFTKLFYKNYWYYNNKLFDSYCTSAAHIQVMNCFTGDVYFSNFHFLDNLYQINSHNIKNISKYNKIYTQNSSNKIAAFISYRNESKWNFNNNGVTSLCNLRTRIALEGKIYNKIDIFGKGWPNSSLTTENSREQSNWTDVKLQHLSKYHFNLCFENCLCPYYVTEKIWHSIISRNLPIYYAGKNHTIYKDFPANSFIDYADFEDPVSLFNFIDHLSATEYNRRINVCIDVLERSLNYSNDGLFPKTQQLSAINNVLNSKPLNSRKWPISKCIGSLDWITILGKQDPIILDIGSNDGQSSVVFLSQMSKATVIAFEPDPRAIARFKLRKEGQLLNCNITLFEGALSDQDGYIDFNQSNGKNSNLDWHETGWDLSGSIKSPLKHLSEYPTISFESKIKVRTTTLDAYIKNNDLNFDIIDLAWIDVQGAEKNVLDGAKNTLHKIRYIHMEYSDKEMYEGQMDLDTTLSYLKDFELVQIYDGDILLKNKYLS
jgi:FkbM family methyltransferase